MLQGGDHRATNHGKQQRTTRIQETREAELQGEARMQNWAALNCAMGRHAASAEAETHRQGDHQARCCKKPARNHSQSTAAAQRMHRLHPKHTADIEGNPTTALSSSDVAQVLSLQSYPSAPTTTPLNRACWLLLYSEAQIPFKPCLRSTVRDFRPLYYLYKGLSS